MTPEFRWLQSIVSPAAELSAESPDPFPESEPDAWYEVTLCKVPWATSAPSIACLLSAMSESLDSVLVAKRKQFI